MEEHGVSAEEPRRSDSEPGLGRALALAGFLAAAKIAATATGLVLSATGVLSGANVPSKHDETTHGRA